MKRSHCDGHSQFRGDLFAQRTLRRLLGRHHPSAQRRTGSPGSRVAIDPRRMEGAPARNRDPDCRSRSPQEEPSAFPQQERRPAPQRESAPAPEAPLFPPDIDALAIAEAQKQAAAEGVPFCEECLRAQMATAGKP